MHILTDITVYLSVSVNYHTINAGTRSTRTYRKCGPTFERQSRTAGTGKLTIEDADGCDEQPPRKRPKTKIKYVLAHVVSRD
jgi:hypothetical protein